MTRGLRCVLFVLSFLYLAAAHAQTAERLAEVRTPYLEAEPRGVVNLQLYLANTSAVSPWIITTQVALSRGWNLVAPPGELTLAPGESLILVLPVLVAPGATAGAYTFPIDLGDSAEDPELTFTVRVNPVDRIDVAVLRAPALKAAGPFISEFLVSNRGNSPRELTLSARSSSNLHVEVEPAKFMLAPGESQEVSVRTAVPTDLGSRQFHVLTLTVNSAGEPPLTAIARSTTDLIPRRLTAASALHTFPLDLRFSSSIGNAAPASSLAGRSPTLELSGAGELVPGDAGRLGVRLKASYGKGLEEFRVDYRRHDFAVALGEVGVGASKLTSAVEAFGVRVEQAWDLPSEIRLTGAGGLYLREGEPLFDLTIAASRGQETGLALSLLTTAEGQQAVLSIEHSPTWADPTALQLAKVGAAYGVRFLPREDRIGHGVGFDVRFSEGPSIADLRLTSTSASFGGNDYHRALFSVVSNLRVTEALRLRPEVPLNLRFGYSDEWRWDGQLPFASILTETPRATTTKYSAGLSTSLGPARMAVNYQRTDRSESGGFQQENSTSAKLTLGSAGSSSLSQQISWTNRADEAAARQDELEYVAEVAVGTPGEGRLTTNLSATFEMAPWTAEEVSFGVSWRGKLSAVTHLSLAADLNLLDASELAEFDLEFNHEFANGHALDLQLLSQVFRGAPSTLAVGVAYAMPIHVPLGRLPGFGQVSGRMLDQSGQPVGGAIAMLANLATVVQADGAFNFPAVPEGDHLLQIVTNGALQPTQLVLPASPIALSVVAGERSEVDLQVVEGAALTGTLHLAQPEDVGEALVGREGAGGDLVAGVRMELRRGSSVLHTVTDSGGSFAFRHLLPGDWILRVIYPNLPSEYRIEPAEQTVSLKSGATGQVSVQITPVVRRIQFMEGGVLEPETGD